MTVHPPSSVLDRSSRAHARPFQALGVYINVGSSVWTSRFTASGVGGGRVPRPRRPSTGRPEYYGARGGLILSEPADPCGACRPGFSRCRSETASSGRPLCKAYHRSWRLSPPGFVQNDPQLGRPDSLRMRSMVFSLEVQESSSSLAATGSPLSARCVHDCGVFCSRHPSAPVGLAQIPSILTKGRCHRCSGR